MTDTMTSEKGLLRLPLIRGMATGVEMRGRHGLGHNTGGYSLDGVVPMPMADEKVLIRAATRRGMSSLRRRVPSGRRQERSGVAW